MSTQSGCAIQPDWQRRPLDHAGVHGQVGLSAAVGAMAFASFASRSQGSSYYQRLRALVERRLDNMRVSRIRADEPGAVRYQFRIADQSRFRQPRTKAKRL